MERVLSEARLGEVFMSTHKLILSYSQQVVTYHPDASSSFNGLEFETEFDSALISCEVDCALISCEVEPFFNDV